MLTKGWARNVLKSMQWSKRKSTTGKTEPSEQFMCEEMLTFQKRISNVTEDYLSGAKTEKLQIKVTFEVTTNGKFLPVRVFYEWKTHRCLPDFKFPKCFNVTCSANFKFLKCCNVPYSVNHWSSTAKSIDLFEQIIFPYLNDIKEFLNYPKEKRLLIIKDTFKRQDNKVIMDFCKENFCYAVIIRGNVTNKFQSLDIIVNKPAK